jgi:hypothetical protein
MLVLGGITDYANITNEGQSSQIRVVTETVITKNDKHGIAILHVR